VKHTKAIAIIGPSKSGKTSLLEKLIPLVKSRGLRVAAVKHAPHRIELDRPNSDTDRMFTSGADAVAIIGERESAIRTRPTLDIPSILQTFKDYDLVFFEGFKKSGLLKIEVVPQGKSPLTPTPSNVIARITESKYPSIPSFTHEQVDELLEFILEKIS